LICFQALKIKGLLRRLHPIKVASFWAEQAC